MHTPMKFEQIMLSPSRFFDQVFETSDTDPKIINNVRSAIRNILFFAMEVPWYVVTSPILHLNDRVRSAVKDNIS